MSRWRFVSWIAAAGLLCGTALAQVPMPPVRGGGTGTRRPRQEPCWQVAGISKGAMEQERVVRQQARQEVEAVCANSSLTLQQKRQQIREIREKEKQQIDTIVSPQQREALRACREERGQGGHGHGMGGGHGSGPCGEMETPTPKNPVPEPPKN